MELCNLALVPDQSSCDDLAGLNKNFVTSFSCNSGVGDSNNTSYSSALLIGEVDL